MDVSLSKEPLIDHEVRAYVLSLCSALGGTSAEDDGRYILGDDALAVLKDIKRWLKLYDEKLARLDVARLLAEANLVKGDLLEILASWPEDAPEGSFRQKIALTCVDLLTVLTWPIDKDEMTATMHRYLHMPFLHKAQAAYKSAILHYDDRDMLRTIVRVALPALANPKSERTPYQDSVIKVVLYFFRNIALISQPEDVPVDEIDSDISRSTTISAFHKQDIFNLILTVCSSLQEDFVIHDVEVMEIVFHILKGIDVESLFMDKQELTSSNAKELKDLMSKEKSLLAGYARHAPSRHNRFTPMIWIKRDDEKMSTVFGQRGVGSTASGVAELDRRKQWKKPRQSRKIDKSENSSAAFDTSLPLTSAAREQLRNFVEQFLDSSFNPLFLSVRKSIEREAPRVLKAHSRHYMYLVSWFLRAECARRRQQASKKTQRPDSEPRELDSFSLVASVMNQETFVLLNRFMQRAQDEKDWQDLNAGMKCFTQILLTVQEMSESPLDEDQEISENILNRIFYEQTTHDRIIAFLRSYKDQGFGYLDACTELSHVFIRLLERYSKQNVDLQVRSRRRARKKKQIITNEGQESGEQEDRAMDAEDVAEAHRTSSERKFDFSKFERKFVNEASVNTFIALLRYYKDISPQQLKRVHRFLHRVAFKMECPTYLFRADIIALLNKLIKGPDGLDIENSTYKEWGELTKQLFRKLVRRLEERPALFVELLFSKIPPTLFYLEHGYDNEPPKRAPRAAAVLEVKPGVEDDDRIGVAVSLLINQSKFDALSWVKGVLKSASEERKAWEDVNSTLASNTQHEANTATDDTTAEQAIRILESSTEVFPSNEQPKAPVIFVRPDNDDRGDSLFRDKYLRLLLSVLSLQDLTSAYEGEDHRKGEASWIIPSSLTSTELTRLEGVIGKFEYEPPVYENGSSAEDMIRRKATAKPYRAQRNNKSDSEGDSDLEQMFPAGGPNIHRPSHSPERGPRRQRNRHEPDELIDESVLEARREARRRLEAERRSKIKSTLFVHESDDESDEERDKEFFAKEEERRKAAQKGLLEAMRKARESNLNNEKGPSKRKSRMKRKKALSDSDHELSSFADEDEATSLPKKKARSNPSDKVNSGSEDDVSTASNTPVRQTANPLESTDENDSNAETDTDTPPSSQRPSSANAEVRNTRHNEEDAEMSEAAQSGSDKENADAGSQKPTSSAAARRNIRAGFIIESDSDD